MTHKYTPLTKAIELNNFKIYEIVKLIQSYKLKIYCSLLDGYLAQTSIHQSDEPIVEKDLFAITNIAINNKVFVKIHYCHLADVVRLILGQKQNIDISLVHFNEYPCVYLEDYDWKEFLDIVTKDKINENWYNFPTIETKSPDADLRSQYLVNDIANEYEKFVEKISITRLYINDEELKSLKIVKNFSEEITQKLLIETPKETCDEILKKTIIAIHSEVTKEIRNDIAKEMLSDVAKEIRSDIAKELHSDIAKEILSHVAPKTPNKIQKKIAKETTKSQKKEPQYKNDCLQIAEIEWNKQQNSGETIVRVRTMAKAIVDVLKRRQMNINFDVLNVEKVREWIIEKAPEGALRVGNICLFEKKFVINTDESD